VRVGGSGDSLGDNSGEGRGRSWFGRKRSRNRHQHVAASRHDKLFDALRSSLWFRPGLWMLAFAGLALGLVALDTWLDGRLEPEAVPRLLRSDPDDTRALLEAIHDEAGEQIRITVHRQTLDHDFERACTQLGRPLLDRLDLRDPILVSAVR
jgi:hypothetical protein